MKQASNEGGEFREGDEGGKNGLLRCVNEHGHGLVMNSTSR